MNGASLYARRHLERRPDFPGSSVTRGLALRGWSWRRMAYEKRRQVSCLLHVAKFPQVMFGRVRPLSRGRALQYTRSLELQISK
jgi:hypothetical protein